MKPLLEVKQLTVLHNNKKLLDNVSFTLHENERLAIVGQSGSGKSLTLSAIGCLMPAQMHLQGKILWKGENISTLPTKKIQSVRRNGIAYVLQEAMSCLNPSMKIGKQIQETSTSDNIIEWLKLVGISQPHHVANCYPHQCSGGMCQRITLAIALASKPQLLLADEITSALDHTTQEQIIDLIDSLCGKLNVALAIVTHDISIAQRLCTRAIVLHEGNLIEEGSITDLINDPQHANTKNLINCAGLC